MVIILLNLFGDFFYNYIFCLTKKKNLLSAIYNIKKNIYIFLEILFQGLFW